jgi:uncharacterized protein (TIGR03435 family)
VKRGLLAAIAISLPMAGIAQTTKPLAFDVASVRLFVPGTRGANVVSPARVDLVNMPLRAVLLMAFRIDDKLLVAPDWVRDVRVEIHAISPAGTPREQIPAMLRALLADRFGLVAHTEQRPLEAHYLVVGPDGMKMREVEAVNELTKEFPPSPLPNTDFTSETIDGPSRLMMITLGQRRVTERSMHEQVYTARGTIDLNAVRMTMPEFATLLASQLDDLVIDKTGLAGVYQFKVELPNDAGARGLLRAGVTTTVQGTPLTEPTGVSTFKAVEGLGLKLERRRAPLDVIVVDQIQRTPTEN